MSGIGSSVLRTVLAKERDIGILGIVCAILTVAMAPAQLGPDSLRFFR